MASSAPRLTPALIKLADEIEIREMFAQQLPGNPKYEPDARIIASEYEARCVSFQKGRKYP